MENFLHLAQTETNAALVVINIALVFSLELVVVWVYRLTHRALSYSQSFMTTIILMGVIASLIMMVVTENIVGAFALLGAFSLIRFRTIVKETRDIAFVFFSLAIGVAVGTNNYTVAVMGTILISAIILILPRLKIGAPELSGYIIIVAGREPFLPEKEAPWQKFLTNQRTLHVKTLAHNLREYTLAAQFRNVQETGKFVDSLKSTQGVETVELISGKDTVEY